MKDAEVTEALRKYLCPIGCGPVDAGGGDKKRLRCPVCKRRWWRFPEWYGESVLEFRVLKEGGE